MDPINSNEIIEAALRSGNRALCDIFKADVMALYSPMMRGLDDIVKNEIENLNDGSNDNQNRLVVVLETTGGYIEVVERIVSTFRRHYQEVDFVVPNYAYSAGTILALSGDEIYMNYYSVLGPIDPQFDTEHGQVPGMGYIAKYNSLVKRINEVSDEELDTVKAEMAFLMKKFDPAQLFHIEQAIRHSQELIERWLPKYKFKNWKKTEARKIDVDEEYKRERANRIATVLGDAEHWHSHGRGISMADLASEMIGLKVQDFDSDPKISDNITHFHGLLSDFMQACGMTAAIHTERRLRRIA